MYTSLTTLKEFVLPESIQDKDDWDSMLLAIGAGTADLFDTRCNRKLRREVDAIAEFGGEHSCFVLPRYPIETIASVHTRSTPSDAWREEPSAIQTQSDQSGLISFCGRIAHVCERIQVTYTAGYFVDITGETALPDGATPMPADLMLAWYQQCAHVFEQRDKLGSNFTGADRGLGGALVSLIQIGLTDPVEQVLQGHKRFQIL